MPAGVYINWSLYDDLIKSSLSNMTIREFIKKFSIPIAETTIGRRAIKLGIKPKQYKHGLKNYDAELINKIKALKDNHTISEISTLCNISKPVIVRICKRYNIKLSEAGKHRALISSKTKCIGKVPWNKGKQLSQETKEKIAIARQKMSGRTSQLQSTFYRILDELGITYYKDNHQLCRFGFYVFDCRIVHNNLDFLVEVQGEYIHSQPKTVSKDKAKATYMANYFPYIPIKYIYENEFGASNRIKQQIKKWLNLTPSMTIDFNIKDVILKSIDDSTASEFLNAFHYLGKLSGRIKIGAYLNNKLIAVLIYGAPTRIETAHRLNVNNLECLELRRFVIHDEYHKKNFASWLLSKSIKLIPNTIKVLVSFADPGMNHIGTIYKASNWLFDGYTTESYFYIDNDGYVILKKTLYNLAHKLHMKESEYVELHNYTKIITPPKLRYIKWVK